ncbi:hypothetical protein [uncultured Pseudoteredinibacter sp.]|uniref:hypothetical protein n=1 Tax=uncultured Pseudoteredinibacter sp. TaxID=1641701 RepID=UPI002619D54C|nr:hypothetical protein [uncultured Pseudoteredinibacter sp.]
MDSRVITRKLIVGIATGLPGLHKLIVFLVVQNSMSVEELGKFASDFSLLQVLASFTMVGWAGLVMTRTPKLKGDCGEFQFQLFLTSTLYCSVFCFGLLLLDCWGMVFDIKGAILVTFMLMYYQLLRHKKIVEGKFLEIVLVDILSILVFIAFSFSMTPLVCLCLSYFTSVILFLRNMDFDIKFSVLRCFDQLKSFQVAVSNFIQSAPLLSLPFVVNAKFGSDYSALLGVSISYLFLLNLAPRGISSVFLPRLARAFSAEYGVVKTFNRYLRINSISVFVLSVVIGGVVAGFYQFMDIQLLKLDSSIYILIALLLLLVSVAVAIPVTDYFLASEEVVVTFKWSVITFIFSAISTTIFYLLAREGIHIFMLIVAYFMFSLMRSVFLYWKALDRMSSVSQVRTW